METRAAYVAVGAFVLALLVGLVVAVMWLAHGQFTRKMVRYDTYFARVVTGLVDGSPVRISGVQVGHVVDVALDPKNPSRVRVTMEVAANAPIRSDSVASLEVQPLTGSAAIEITPGSIKAPPLQVKEGQKYPVIWSRESEMQMLVQSLPHLLENIVTVTDKLSQVMNEKNRAALTDTLANLNRVTSVAAAHSDDIDRLLSESAADAKELRQTIGAMNDATRRLDKVADQAGVAIRNINGMVQENRKPLRDFTRNGLDELRQLVANTQTLVRAMTRTVDAIDRNPSRLLYGDQRGGYRPQ